VYRAEIRSGVAEAIRALPPEVKRAVKAAIRTISADPTAGEPLQGELEGRFKYRVRRYRIVYRIDRVTKVVDIIGVGHRRNIYEELAEQRKQEK
jgi:mRNA-degrading endonuclease RelE of RelBE toxin-antitoxin system